MAGFPRSLIEFQKRFPDAAACAGYLREARWPGRFVCPPSGVGGRSHRGKILVAGAVAVQEQGPGRIRLSVIKDFSGASLHRFPRAAVAPRATAKTDGWSGCPGAPGVSHDPHVIGPIAAHIVLPWVHRVPSSLKTWALGVHHGLRRKHIQTCLDAFVFRFNRRRTRQAAFRTLLGIGAVTRPVTCEMLIAPEARA